MTDFENQAQKEIALMHECDHLCTKTGVAPYNILTYANTHAKDFKDKDGNNINEFFIQNGVDNHHLNLKDTKSLSIKDLRPMIADEIKAINGDTETLLHE